MVARSRYLCTWIKADGTLCRAQKEKGREYCKHHPPDDVLQHLDESKKMPNEAEILAAPLTDLLCWKLETYQDVVLWKKNLLNLQLKGGVQLARAQALDKLLSSLAESMTLADKMDPDKESKRQFSIEAAVQAARKLSGKQAMQILRAGGTNFLDFLQNPVIDATLVDAEEIEDAAEDVEEVKRKALTADTGEVTKAFIEMRAQVEDLKAEIKQNIEGRDLEGEEYEHRRRNNWGDYSRKEREVEPDTFDLAEFIGSDGEDY